MRWWAVRGLRFRLTASYALFFTVLTAGSAVLFRQFLSASFDSQARDILEQEWGTAKGYLRIEHGNPNWYVDIHDPDEYAVGARLRQVFLLADLKGNLIQHSAEFDTLGLNSAPDIRTKAADSGKWIEAKNEKGDPYLVRKGLITDESPPNTAYYFALGRSLEQDHRFVRKFDLLALGLVPLLVLSGSWAGWFLSGKGLSPVLQVAKAAERISGSDLSHRIPPRGAGDELDFLVETFNRMIDRLEASFVQVRQFSTDVSHELRTPITIIRGQLEVALMTADTKEQYRDAIVDSLGDIDRLTQIVRSLLLLSQAETGQVVIARSEFDLSELVQEIGEQFQIPAESASINLVIEAPGECTVSLDRIQIERMLSNLLSNALKFTQPGGTVTLKLACAVSSLIFTVSDTGRGIDSKHLPHIFDRFYRVNSTESESTPERGLGLGLSFVAWIVKVHCGIVDVKSEIGRGTTFTICLPRTESDELRTHAQHGNEQDLITGARVV